MRRSVLMTAGLLLVVLVLAGAAFVGGRLLSRQEQDDAAAEGVVMVGGGDGGEMHQTVSLEIQPASELPAAPPEVAGIFLQREDNSLFVGTGNVSFIASSGQGDTPQFGSEYDGPEIEVLITRDTLVYRDDTMQDFTGGPPSGPLQQVLNPGSLDEVGENSAVSAWGERRGDRVVAEVLVYSAPVVMTRP